MAFLREVLAAGPLPVSEVWARAQTAGLSEGTVQRAKGKLEVRSVYVTEDGRAVSYWLLGAHEPPPVGSAEDDENSVEPWLEAQRKRFPGPCPLDDL
jgi:hypothetical protein